MPKIPAQTTLPSMRLWGALASVRLHDLRATGLGYVTGTLLALILVALPLPFPPHDPFVMWFVDFILKPAADHFIYIKPPDISTSIFYVWLLLAMVLSYPVFFGHMLDIATPSNVPGRSRRLKLTMVRSLLSFLVGVVIFAFYLLPLGIWFVLRWDTMMFEVKWDINDYIQSMTTLMFVTGFAFQLPTLMSGMVWLRITTPGRLAAWRPYVVLAAFILGAVGTPTPDAINQAIVAVPICLLYELGLILARLVPSDERSRARRR